MQSVTGGNAAGLHAELLQRVRKRERQIDIRMSVVMVAAIEQIVIAVDLPAGDGDADGGGVIMRGNDAAGGVRRDSGTAGEENQIGRLPPIERKLDDAPLVH